MPADVLVGFGGMTDTAGTAPWHYNTIHIRNFGDFGSGGGDPEIILTASLSAGSLTLTWDGGTGPYTVQKSSDPSSGDWEDVETTAGNTATVSASGTMEFFRVVQ
jgi:hypothetical protein